MSTLTWIVVAIVVIAIVAIALILSLSRRTRLRPLAPEARARYAESWRQIESRFVDEPQQAVRDADQVVVDVFRERGGQEAALPRQVREARELARDSDGDSMTENLRRAMQHYRGALEDLLGTDPREAAAPRREVAS